MSLNCCIFITILSHTLIFPKKNEKLIKLDFNLDFWSIKGVYFLKNANILNFKLFILGCILGCPSKTCFYKINIAKGTTDPGVDCFDQYFGLVGLVQYA